MRVRRLTVGSAAIAGVAILVLPRLAGPSLGAAPVESVPPGRLPSARSSLFGESLARLELRSGHKAFVLQPARTEGAGDKAWVWYAPTLLAEREEEWQSPGARHAWLFRQLLGSGIHVAGVDVGESYGSPQGRAIYDEFFERMVREHGFSSRPGLLAVSRGGLMAFNWAADHPDRVRCLGAIYPVCNLRSYPRIERLAKAYGMPEEDLRAQIERHNPISRLDPLAAARVPLLLLHGDRDTVVPLESNSAELARRYQALGGNVELVVIREKGHEVVPEFWEARALIAFFRKHLLQQ